MKAAFVNRFPQILRHPDAAHLQHLAALHHNGGIIDVPAIRLRIESRRHCIRTGRLDCFGLRVG